MSIDGHRKTQVDAHVSTVIRVSIDHDAEEPLYLQLAAILRGQIRAGEITSRVPSVKTLTQQYTVAQGTAERALAVLRDEGLIRSRMGRGHFVIRHG
jgi:DNA-binding GntR family transcriptional regulator